MKYYFFLLTLFLAACSSEDTEFLTYTDDVNNFKIDYPATWDTTNINVHMAFMAREDFTDSSDVFSEGMSVSSLPNEGLELDFIVAENIKMAKSFFKDPAVTEEKIKTNAGVEGVRIRLDYESEGLKLTNFATFFNSAEKLITLTQSSEQHNTEKYEELFLKSVKSFGWIEN